MIIHAANAVGKLTTSKSRECSKIDNEDKLSGILALPDWLLLFHCKICTGKEGVFQTENKFTNTLPQTRIQKA
jgi:hypothetical protein